MDNGVFPFELKGVPLIYPPRPVDKKYDGKPGIVAGHVKPTRRGPTGSNDN